jgi:hypothetical protein
MFTYQTLPLLTTFNIIRRLKTGVYLNFLYKFSSTQQNTVLVLFKVWCYCATIGSPQIQHVYKTRHFLKLKLSVRICATWL